MNTAKKIKLFIKRLCYVNPLSHIQLKNIFLNEYQEVEEGTTMIQHIEWHVLFTSSDKYKHKHTYKYTHTFYEYTHFMMMEIYKEKYRLVVLR